MVKVMAIPLFLKPANLGIWNMMNVVMTYTSNSHLGSLNGMNKAIPVLRAQGREVDADSVKDSIFWFNAALAGLDRRPLVGAAVPGGVRRTRGPHHGHRRNRTGPVPVPRVASARRQPVQPD